MTSPVKLQPEPAISFEERMKLKLKPQPLKPVKGFLRNVPAPEKAKVQAPSEVVLPVAQAEVVPSQTQAEVVPPQAQGNVPLSPAQPVQVSLRESYERVQQELYQVYKQEKRQVPRTPADQMVFVQSYKDAVELVKSVYAQGTGEKPPLPEAGWQKCYTETIAMFQTFYGLAQQSPEDLAKSKRLYHQFYTQARKQQPQSATPQKAPVSSPALLQAKTPPSIDPKQIPAAAQPAQPPVAPPAPPTSVKPAPHAVVKPAQPIARSKAETPDLSNYRRWTPLEQQQLQQAKQASQAKAPSSNVQPHVSPSPVHSQSMPQNPPPIAPLPNHSHVSMIPANNAQPSNVPANNAQPNGVRREDSWSQQPRQQRDRQSWDPRASRREYLLRERLFLERELQRSFGNANALNERWQLWETHKAQLEQDKTLVPVKEMFSVVARRLIKIPLPSAARQISFREQRLNQEAIWLQQQAIVINTRHNTLLQEIQIINTELEMLNF